MDDPMLQHRSIDGALVCDRASYRCHHHVLIFVCVTLPSLGKVTQCFHDPMENLLGVALA